MCPMSDPESKPSTGRVKRFDRVVDGILLLDKPQGMSSNAAMQQARGVFRALKAGHAGSLDPLATGMLPICFGQATKVCGYLLNSRKTYRVAAKLGVKTDSADADGVVIEERPVPICDSAQVEAVLAGFRGEQQQVPPMFSALKQGGQRLYEIARSGGSVERAPRAIFIEHIALSDLSLPTLEFEVRCSKGTYVRSLVEDIAMRLGTVAHVTMLRRLQVDPFDAGRMVTLETLQSLGMSQGMSLGASDPAGLGEYLLPPDAALVDVPVLNLDEAQAVDLMHGRVLTGMHAAAPGLLRAYGPDSHFLGLVMTDAAGEVRPERLFPPSSP